MKYYYESKIGNTRYKLPDGTLLCKDVPIFRTGTQEYLAEELPPDLVPDNDGIIKVNRSESEVFSEKTLASFEGVTFVVLHPEDGVTLENWKEVTAGHCQNVRRGTGDKFDLALADIFVRDLQAIKNIDSGMLEISCGYDATYISSGKGTAEQKEIIGNHIALVPHGRAGKRCSIGDSKKMTLKASVKDACLKLKNAFKTKDETAANEAIQVLQQEGIINDDDPQSPQKVEIVIKSEEENTTHDNTPLTREDVIAIVKELLTKTTTGDDDHENKNDDEDDKPDSKTTDAIFTHDALAKAEILMPNINLPSNTSDNEFKRIVLTSLSYTKDGAELLSPILSGKDISKLDNDALNVVFNSASEIKKAQNRNLIKSSVITKDNQHLTSSSDINKFNQNYYWGGK